jgi:hypothetical protein
VLSGANLDICTFVDQQLGHIKKAMVDSGIERRSTSLILTVQINTLGDEKLCSLEMAIPHCRIKHAPAVIAFQVDIRTPPAEQLHYSAISSVSRGVEGRQACIVRCIDLGAGIEQKLHHLLMVFMGCNE